MRVIKIASQLRAAALPKIVWNERVDAEREGIREGNKLSESVYGEINLTAVTET